MHKANIHHTGHCYIIKFKGGICKIGISKNPKERIRGLSNNGLIVEDYFISDRCKNYREIETCLLKLFQSKRVNGEYVKASFEDIKESFNSIELTQYTNEELMRLESDDAKFNEALKNFVSERVNITLDNTIVHEERVILDKETIKYCINHTVSNLPSLLSITIMMVILTSAEKKLGRDAVLRLINKHIEDALSNCIGNALDSVSDAIQVTVTKKFLDDLKGES